MAFANGLLKMDEQPKGTILYGYRVLDLTDEKSMFCARPLAEELGLKTSQLFSTLRVAVTGRTAAPPLFQTMAVLGKECCLRRTEAALDRLGRLPK